MIIQGNCIEVMSQLDAESFNTCVTSPPYWGLRDYGLPATDWKAVTYKPMSGLDDITVPAWTGCLGLEPTPEMFVAHIVLVFRKVWRLLRSDGTAWVNFGDSYAGSRKGAWSNTEGQKEVYVADPKGLQSKIPKNPSGLKNKDLVGIPWRVAFALQADGWYLRSDIIWNKTNAMPESVKDRPTKAHEYFFLFSKSDKYYYDAELIKEKSTTQGSANSFSRKLDESPPPGSTNQHRPSRKYVEYSGMKNKRSVWTVQTQAFPDAHFATFPEELIKPCILAGAPVGGKVLDMFGGSGTTLKVAQENNRECVVIEMNPAYVEIAEQRTSIIQPQMNI